LARTPEAALRAGDANPSGCRPALERQGDFSQSLDNTGRRIRSYATNDRPAVQRERYARLLSRTAACSAAFRRNRLYTPGLAILNAYPLPNTSGSNFNFTSQLPAARDRREDILRVDWQASSAWRMYGRFFHNTNNAGNGLDPYGSFVLGATCRSRRSRICAGEELFVQRDRASSATACSRSDRWQRTQRAEHLRRRGKVEPHGARPHQAADALSRAVRTTTRRSSRSAALGTSPNNGSNNAPFYNFNTTYDVLTNSRRSGAGTTRKAGLYIQRSLKDQSGFGDNNGNINFLRQHLEPFDTSFSIANAATRRCSTPSAGVVYPIGQYRYWNVEWYLQDNWKVTIGSRSTTAFASTGFSRNTTRPS